MLIITRVSVGLWVAASCLVVCKSCCSSGRRRIEVERRKSRHINRSLQLLALASIIIKPSLTHNVRHASLRKRTSSSASSIYISRHSISSSIRIKAHAVLTFACLPPSPAPSRFLSSLSSHRSQVMQRQQREEERIQGAAMSAAMAQAEALGMTPVCSQPAGWIERGRTGWEEGRHRAVWRSGSNVPVCYPAEFVTFVHARHFLLSPYPLYVLGGVAANHRANEHARTAPRRLLPWPSGRPRSGEIFGGQQGTRLSLDDEPGYLIRHL